MQQQLHDADNHQRVSKDGILILFSLVRFGGIWTDTRNVLVGKVPIIPGTFLSR